MNVVHKKVGGFKVYHRQHTVDETVLNHTFDQDIFFAQLWDFKAKAASVIIDVGAHIGTFSLRANQICANAKILAIEASEENFDLLKKNIESNDLQHLILPINVALSDLNGEEKLYKGEESWGYSVSRPSLGKYEMVRAISLTKLFQQQRIDSCDLLKLNCEGAEFKILLTTPSEVVKRIKMMLILFHEDLEENHDRNDLYQYLTSQGFVCRTAYDTKQRGWIVAKNTRDYSIISDWIWRIRNKVKKIFFK